MIERDNRPGTALDGRSVVAIILSALISVAFMRWLPMFVIFFSVPLFVVYLVYGKRVFVVSVFFAFALDMAVSIAAIFVVARQLDAFSLLFSVCQSAFLFFPLFCLFVPGIIKMRYRVLLAGAASAAAWIFLLVGTGAGDALTKMLHEITADTANMMYSMVPEGYERTAFQAEMSPDKLYSIMMQVLSYSVLPLCVMLYAAGYVIASGIAAVMKRSLASRFQAKYFYTDHVVFIPLVCGMAGAIFGKMVRAEHLVTLSWNVLITSGLFFILQGYGILSFFLEFIRPKVNRFVYFLIMFGLIVFALEGWPFLFGALLIAGVVELFVPLRSRFGNKDIADPTPGHGNDQN